MRIFHIRLCSLRRWSIVPALVCLSLVSLGGCRKTKSPESKGQKPKGHFEFQILATEQDDPDIVDATQKWFAETRKDAKRQELLQKLAEQGAPPPTPNLDNGPRYGWIEMAPSLLRSLSLDRDPATGEARKDEEKLDGPFPFVEPELEEKAAKREWIRIVEARVAGVPAPFRAVEGKLANWIWSRDCQSTKIPKENREKQQEFFLLTRLSDPDEAVTEKQLTDVTIVRRNKAVQFSRDAIQFSLDQTSSNPMEKLTKKNKGRYMVVVHDGRIVFRAIIQSVISLKGEITGILTDQELDQFANPPEVGEPEKK